jgi:ABC-2 type transport system permease protein
MVQLLKKELVEIFTGWTEWIAVAVFVLLLNLILWVFPDTSYVSYGYAAPEYLFGFLAYLFVFIVPAISSGSIAREFKHGTWEILASLPFSWRSVVWAKFWAATCVLVIMLACTLPAIGILDVLSLDGKSLAYGQLLGSYFGLLMIGMCFLSLGFLTSSLVENPPIAFVLAVVAGYFLYEGMTFVSSLGQFYGSWDYWINRWSLKYQADFLGRGVIQLSNIVYLTSLTLIFLRMAEFRLKTKTS